MMSSPVFYAASGAHLCEELVSSCSSSADPYKHSMRRLLDYVGLQHYGTPHASVPPRSQAESDAIAKHIEAVTEAMTRHAESVRQRNIRIKRRNPTSVLQEIIGSAATAAVGASAPATPRGEEDAVRTTSPSPSPSMSATAPLPTIYLSFEESAEWKAFLTSVAQEDRLAVTVRRRLTLELWRAHQRGICLWCWFPRNLCMCAQLDAYKAAMPAAVLDQHVEVTMLLHSEELMRSTNSGHIAAYLLGAPIRVWGLDADDFYLRELQPQHRREGGGGEVRGLGEAPSPSPPVVVHNVSLYPSSESIAIEEFIRGKRLGLAQAPAHSREGAVVEAPQQHASVEEVSPATPLVHTEGFAAAPGEVGEGSGVADREGSCTKMHLILLDSTWGQALSLNRKLGKDIPRVKLEIPDSYESLFQALRKRTRESGVSTLEATSMAVEQCVRAMGFVSEATQSAATLTAAMKVFVDARCLLKYAEAQFTTDGVVLDAFRDKRDGARRSDAAQRQVNLAAKMQHDAASRRLRLPPVLNLCYCCDRVIGWHRMAEHVMGRSHRAALERNPACTPSAASRLVKVENFARPTRLERERARELLKGAAEEH